MNATFNQVRPSKTDSLHPQHADERELTAQLLADESRKLWNGGKKKWKLFSDLAFTNKISLSCTSDEKKVQLTLFPAHWLASANSWGFKLVSFTFCSLKLRPCELSSRLFPSRSRKFRVKSFLVWMGIKLEYFLCVLEYGLQRVSTWNGCDWDYKLQCHGPWFRAYEPLRLAHFSVVSSLSFARKKEKSFLWIIKWNK